MLSVGGLFDGVGFLAYGLHLAGWEHSWLCESDEWRRGILAKRWPGVPIYDDVRAVGHGARPVTLIAGGFPCKGASTVGKLEGFGHPETVLWFEMARAIGELRPRYVLVENVANLLALHNGEVWGTVLGGLAAFGYDVVWDCLPASAVGAPHLRDRVFAIATYAADFGPERRGSPRDRGHGLANGGQPSADAARRAGGQDSAGLSRPSDGLISQPEGGRRPRGSGGGARSEMPVEWGQYRGAIERWEAIAGPAPKPLVRGMDARGTARVVRSRLSALGDGVQVQLGVICGRYIAELEEGRLAA